MNRTTNAESTGAFLLVCDLPSAIAAKSVAAFPKAASLRVSFVDPRKRTPRTDRQGRVHEIRGHDERIAAIAKEYAKSPENTLVISPDNRSRMEINQRVHAELQLSGLVSNEEHRIRTLVPRQDLTGADRTWAERYEVGDVLRYSRASKETGIGKGTYAQVKSIDAPKNRLTVGLQDGTERSYDPRRQQGVSVFREEMRSFSVGDRIQFTAPANELKVASRELGTIKSIDEDGRLHLKMKVAARSSSTRASICISIM